MDSAWVLGYGTYNIIFALIRKNKDLRKRIAGLQGPVLRQERIQAELAKPAPNPGYIPKWEKEIEFARKRVRKLEGRLGRYAMRKKQAKAAAVPDTEVLKGPMTEYLEMLREAERGVRKVALS